MNIHSQKIFVAGHRGMVGSAIVRNLLKNGFSNILCINRGDLNLTNQLEVQNFFLKEKPDQVYIAAAKVGGIYANNTFPAEFIYENLMIQSNVIHQAFLNGVKKLLFLGSSCIYPKLAQQPMSESELLSGKLEATNEPYAIAKIAGIKLCESYNRQYSQIHGVDYRSVMPTNLYGPGDNYHSLNSHVIPALIKRFHEASQKKYKEVNVWGSGNQKREFLHVDDLASACVFIMNLKKELFNKYVETQQSHINIGSGEEIKISDLAFKIAKITKYSGNVKFDIKKPEGPSQKKVSLKKITELGWKPTIFLEEGLRHTYNDYLCQINESKY